MSRTLLILNDGPQSERSYNGLRLAGSLARRDGEEVRIFLMGDAAACARNGQSPGDREVAPMLARVANNGIAVGVCASCMDARAISASQLVEGTHRGTLDELTSWTAWAERTIVF